MTPEERREHIRREVDKWPALTERQRIRLAVLLRPDLPVGIQRTKAKPNKAKPNKAKPTT